MRLMLASLIAAVAAAPLALAQTPPPAAPTPPTAQPAVTPPGTPAPPAPAAETPPTATPPATPPASTSPEPSPAAAAPETPAAAPTPPPAPPAPPTDPTAIALLDTLQQVCIPAVEGGKLDKLARSLGYRSNDGNYVLKGHGRPYEFTILAPGSNPTQCHVDMVHPIYPEAPAAAMVVALHNWATMERGWSLYRNDKSVDANNQQLTTRSWEHDDPGKHEALVIVTFRHADGTPMKRDADTSTLIYSETPTGQ